MHRAHYRRHGRSVTTAPGRPDDRAAAAMRSRKVSTSVTRWPLFLSTVFKSRPVAGSSSARSTSSPLPSACVQREFLPLSLIGSRRLDALHAACRTPISERSRSGRTQPGIIACAKEAGTASAFRIDEKDAAGGPDCGRRGACADRPDRRSASRRSTTMSVRGIGGETASRLAATSAGVAASMTLPPRLVTVGGQRSRQAPSGAMTSLCVLDSMVARAWRRRISDGCPTACAG